MQNLKKKMVQMNLFTEQKQSHICRKQTCYQGGKWGGGVNWEIGIGIYTLLYIKQITNKDLLYKKTNKKTANAKLSLGYLYGNMLI